jgi:hypothetical protein
VRVEAVAHAAEHRREVEAEAVDAHLLHPVAQRVQHELRHARVRHVQRVAAAAVVFAAARVVGREAVPALVVQAAEAQRRPVFVALGRVVVDHVEHTSSPCSCSVATMRRNSSFTAVGSLRVLRVARVGPQKKPSVL